MKRTRIKPVSDRRRAVNKLRAEMMEEHFGPRDTWACWVRSRPAMALVMGGCYGDVNGHEVVKRSQGGSIVDPTNILLLCNRHNSFVENEPDIAHKFGLMRHSWEVD